MDLSLFEYPPVASTRVTQLPKVLLNASHISVGYSVTIIAHLARSIKVNCI
ncbi:hypothetical protein [uncultured Holdemanella sp.]|uniref:hypothetical protein n=1 Tax=uncultured Holdemanella sp. TaxID=1763549 RepID=UPI0025EB3775|nr:hypothetical protein [uncultured Holdemanella sp.]